MPPKFNAAIKVIIIQFALLVCFLLLIIGAIELQYWYRYSIKLPPNDSSTITWGHAVKKNTWGFREKNFDLPALRQTDHFVILVLGDSLTWGVGLEETQRYSNLLEEYLRAEYSSKKIVVMNFAIPGGSTTKERDVLRAYYKKIKPDLIIVGFCYNDPQEKEQHYSREREFYFSKINPILFSLNQYKMTGTAKLIAKVYENILTATQKIPLWSVALDRVYAQDSADWHRFEDALKDITAMSKDVTPHLPLFLILTQRNPTQNNYLLKWYDLAESAAKKYGFLTANCEEEFKTQLKNHVMDVVPGEDGHPTAEMNQIYARKLVSMIKENKFFN